MFDRRTIAAIGHPIRVAILAEFRERDITSPREIAEKLDRPLGTVAYHFRRLESLGFLRLAKRVQRRGAIAHYYRLRVQEHPQVPGADVVRSWLEPNSNRRELSVVLDAVAMDDLRVSAETLYARMQQLEAATVTRTGVERAGPTFTVHVGFDVQRLSSTTSGEQ